MKKLSIFFATVLLLQMLTACANETGNDHAQPTGLLSEEADSGFQTAIVTEVVTEKPLIKTRYGPIAFFAESGAVIVEYTYDLYGYLDGCVYKRKCDFCGYVDSMPIPSGGNVSGAGFDCRNCKHKNRIVIRCQYDYMPIYE